MRCIIDLLDLLPSMLGVKCFIGRGVFFNSQFSAISKARFFVPEIESKRETP